MNFDDEKLIDLYDYDSPIRTVAKQIAREFDDGVFKVVTETGIDVDKEELVKALQYDRNQYEKGFNDGAKARDARIVRCKDCVYARKDKPTDTFFDCNFFADKSVVDTDYCSWGERCEE